MKLRIKILGNSPNARALAILSGIGGLVAPSVSFAQNCSGEDIQQVRREAQTLDPKVEADAKHLSAHCPHLRDEALFWLAGFYRAKGEYRQAADLAPSEALPAGTDRDRAFSDALQGHPDDLEKKIHSGEPGFGGDAEAMLLLARSRSMNHQFAEARDAYDDYLKLKGSDHDVEIETAYTALWQGDGDEARSRFQALKKRGGLNPTQTAAVDDGIERSGLMDSSSALSLPHPLSAPAVDFDVESHSSTFYGFHRTTYGLSYRGANATGALKFHLMSSSRPEPIADGGFEARTGYADQLSSRISYQFSMGGEFSTTSVFIGDVIVAYRAGDGWVPYIGAYRSALALDIPIPKAYSDQTLWAIVAGFRFQDAFEYRFETKNATGWTTGSHHEGKLHFSVREPNGSGAFSGRIRLGIEADYDGYARANPYLYTPKSATVLRVGVDYSAHFTPRLDGLVGVDIGSVFESPQAGSGFSYGTSASLVGLHGDFTYTLNPLWQARFKAALDHTSGEDGKTTYGAASFVIGLSRSLGEPNPPRGEK